MTPGNLFYDCPVPGCSQPVTDPREPCATCREMFGDNLTPGRASTEPEAFATQLAERDEEVAAAYARQQAGPRPEEPPGAGVETEPAVLDMLGAAQVPARTRPSRPVDLQGLPG